MSRAEAWGRWAATGTAPLLLTFSLFLLVGQATSAPGADRPTTEEVSESLKQPRQEKSSGPKKTEDKKLQEKKPELKKPEVKQPEGPKEVTNSIGMKLMRIPAGKFHMGLPPAERDALLKNIPEAKRKTAEEELDREGPQHEVEITKPYYLGACEVTQEEYQRITGGNPSYFCQQGGGKERVKGIDTKKFPVEGVSYTQAVKFCELLSALPEERKAGRVYRLPTEAEWERACRAGGSSAHPYHTGKGLSSDQANFNGLYPFGTDTKGFWLNRTAQVGSYKANAYGLFDMHGNVAEWVSDSYNKDGYRTSAKTDPKGPEKGELRILRGGHWVLDGRDCRAASRLLTRPDSGSSYLGFRVVVSFPIK